MCPLRYDYEHDRNDGAGSSRLRSVIIFVVALGVIGCGIYFFILPHTGIVPSKPDSAPPSAVDGKNAETTPDNAQDAAKTADVPNATAVPTSGEAENNLPAAIIENGDPALAEQRKPSDPGNADAPVPNELADLSGSGKTRDPAPTADPQKGKPWVGDPPSELPSAPDSPAETPQPQIDPLAAAETAVVRAGESLSRIAQKHHTTVDALRHYNKLSNDVIRVGQKLRVIPGPWRITVNQNRRLLTLERLRNGKWNEFAVFSVGLGRLGSTPNARFVISTRLRHPDWYTPDGRIYRYGDPENQLGDYFLKLAASGKPDKPLLGYGIHGTPDENSVGKNWSSGCVRMRNRDVEILYYLVPSGTQVRIVPGADEPRKTEI